MSAQSSHITIVSVPSAAGTHWEGQSKAPSALLNHGLETKLSLIGHATSTINALPALVPYRPQPLINGVRNEQAVLEVMQQVRDAITKLLCSPPNTIPLVLGGDCSITPAILSAICTSKPEKKVGIIYFDGDVDLSLPATVAGADSDTCILDSMVLSHLTLREGSLKSMQQYSQLDKISGNPNPLAHKDNIILFGFDPLQPKPEHFLYLLENNFKAIGAPTVRKDPQTAARAALKWLEERCDAVFVHFDVDVIDSALFPLGNYPHYAGLHFEEAMSALRVFVGSEKLVGMVVTEVNPGNDGSGEMVEMLVDGIVEAFGGILSKT